MIVRFEGDTIQRFEVDGPVLARNLWCGRQGARGASLPGCRRGAQREAEGRTGRRRRHRVSRSGVGARGDRRRRRGRDLVPEGAAMDARLRDHAGRFAAAASGRHRARDRRATRRRKRRSPRADGRSYCDRQRPAEWRALTRGNTLVELIARNERLGEAPVLRLEVSQAEASLRLAQQDLRARRTARDCGRRAAAATGRSARGA